MAYITPQINQVTKVLQDIQEVPVVNLDERVAGMSEEGLVNTFAGYAVQSEQRKNRAHQILDNPATLSPEKLIALQNQVLNYNVEVSLMATLARKTVGAVETLLRS
ncbi:type III secretion system inner rod subunit SctI [Enterobacter ludwigii]|uniref:type III secretion system inner rod subunit SctI n=1 Tax=Enterobacter ludwigii TaxID=299767 RepID=UPI003975A0E9